MIIRWKGKIGYGDVISPICYAINISEAANRLVELQFNWPHDRQEDPEHISNIAQRIYDRLDPQLVTVSHIYKSTMRENNTNYPFEVFRAEHKYHNVYIPPGWRSRKPSKSLIVICDPLDNQLSLAAYGAHKAWKDGLSADQWNYLIKSYSNSYPVARINYKTPFDRVVELLGMCHHFIGYHGSCAWVARLIGCPMTILSKDPQFSANVFPWATTDYPHSVESARKQSIHKLAIARNERFDYVSQLNSLYRT